MAKAYLLFSFRSSYGSSKVGVVICTWGLLLYRKCRKPGMLRSPTEYSDLPSVIESTKACIMPSRSSFYGTRVQREDTGREDNGAYLRDSGTPPPHRFELCQPTHTY